MAVNDHLYSENNYECSHVKFVDIQTNLKYK